MATFLSKKQVDRLGKSFFYFGMHNFLKNIGEPAVLFDKSRADKTLLRLQSYYNNKGFFDVKATYKTDTINSKKLKIKYDITLNKPYIIDTINIKIQTPELDSIYLS